MNEKLRDLILDNEDRIIEHFYNNDDIVKSAKSTKLKVSLLNNDKNIFDYCVKTFANGNSDKKFLEQIYRKDGLLSCRDFVLKHEKEFDMNDKFSPADLHENYTYNYMMVCALANKFDIQGGILVFENKKEVVVKIGARSTYEDSWLDYEKTLLIYNMKIKSNEKTFDEWIGKKENRIIYESIIQNKPLTIYVFVNTGNGYYRYLGTFKPIDITSTKDAFILERL